MGRDSLKTWMRILAIAGVFVGERANAGCTTATITSGPPTYNPSTSASFSFNILGTHCSPNPECKLDGGAWTSCSSPKSYSSLSQGAHTFSVRDNGITFPDPTDSHAWTVDTVAPQTTISSGPPTRTNDNTPTFSFSANESATFQCRNNGSAWAACTSPHTTSTLADGNYKFDVRATDFAGNVDVTHAEISFTVDTVLPVTTLTAGSADYTNDRTPTFTFSSNESGTFECRIDAGAWTACSSPHTSSKLSLGNRTFEVRAKDLAGNYDSTAEGDTFEVGRFDVYEYEGVWAFTATGLDLLNVAVTSTNAFLVSDITNAAGAYDVAVDEGTGSVWTLGADENIRIYTAEGSLIATATPSPTPATGDIVEIATDPEDGSAWIGYANTLLHYTSAGTHVRTVSTASAVKGLAFDIAGDRVIVAQGDRVTAHAEATGNISMTISLSGAGTAVDVANDPYSRDIWVLTDTYLLGYSSTGTLLGGTTLSGGTAIGVDGIGGVWVARGPDLDHYDVGLSLLENLEPFGAMGAISSLSTDPFNGSVWITDGSSVLQLNEAGSTVSSFEARGAVSRLVLTDQLYSVPSSQASDLSPGVILKAVGSEWKVHYVLAGSGGWDQDVRPDDEVLSINGVNVPSTSSTIAQLDSFSSSVASARSGGVDVYLVERGGTQSTKSLSLGSFAMLKRKSNGYRIGVVAYALVAKLLHEGSSGARCFVCENDVYGGSNVYGSGCKKVDGGWIVCIEMLTLPDGFDPEGGEENAGSIMCQTDGPPTCFPPGVNMP